MTCLFVVVTIMGLPRSQHCHAGVMPVTAFTDPLLQLVRQHLTSGRTSAVALARVSGLSRGTIYAMLAPNARSPGIGALEAIARALGVTIRLVVDGVESSQPPPPRLPVPPRQPLIFRTMPLADAIITTHWQAAAGDLARCAQSLQAKPHGLQLRLIRLGLCEPTSATIRDQAARLDAIIAMRQTGLSLRAIGQHLGVSGQYVSQFLNSAYIEGPTR